MNLDELSNFFGLTAEVVIGILAFQGIATTFIFSRKGEWTYADVWEFGNKNCVIERDTIFL